MVEEKKPFIRLRNGRKGWSAGDERIEIIRGINLDIFVGTSVAIMGPSGAGKSTLLHILGLLTPLDDGELWFDGRPIRNAADGWDSSLRCLIGFIFQDAKLISELSVMENVCVPLMHRGIWPARQKKLALEALARVGLEKRTSHTPNQLSGGELMRAAIARAIVQRPKILLADEPTGNLDSVTGSRIRILLMEMVTPQRALVFVTHNEDVAGHADRLVIIKDGKIQTDN